MAANARAASIAIVVERKEAGKEYLVQRLIYYISEVLIESKQRYPHWQKLVYGVFMASRKLKQYFQGHPITVVSSAPLGEVRTMPAPKPVRILDPSKCIRQWVESGAGGKYWVSAQSTRKSANACDLMAAWG